MTTSLRIGGRSRYICSSPWKIIRVVTPSTRLQSTSQYPTFETADRMMYQEKEKHVGDWPNAVGFQVEAEQREPVELPIKGFFPAAAAGTLLRTGPSSHIAGDFKLSHWFDGFTQIYRFQLKPQADGSCRVWYNSRRQCDGLIERARKTGRLDQITFGQKNDPCKGFFGKIMAIFHAFRAAPDTPSQSNSGVTISPHVSDKSSGLLETRTDQAMFKRVDMETLEPVGVTDQTSLHPDLVGPLASAHAQFEPVNGDAFNYNLQFGRFATYRIFRTSATTGKTDVLATITGPDVHAAYLHSFFLTENYVVLCVWNAHFAMGGIKMLWERNMVEAISPFDENMPVHWFVVDRRNGKGLVKRFSSHAMFAFHTANAFEVPNESGTTDIFCDLVEYPSSDVLHLTYYDNLKSNGSGAAGQPLKESNLSRYKLSEISCASTWDSAADQAPAAEEILRIPFNGDLPTLNPSYKTKEQRFVYGICDQGKSSFYDSLIKVDMHSQQAMRWGKDKHTPGEPIFVVDEARRDKEDGGWLLSCVLDGFAGTSYLLCLDAETMQEVGRAESNVPWGIGFHGTMIRGASL